MKVQTVIISCEHFYMADSYLIPVCLSEHLNLQFNLFKNQYIYKDNIWFTFESYNF